MCAFLSAIRSFVSKDVSYAGKSRFSVYFNTFTALALGLTGLILAFIDSRYGLNVEAGSMPLFYFEAILTVVHSCIITGSVGKEQIKSSGRLWPSVFSIIFVLLFAGFAVAACLTDIAQISFSALGFSSEISINGLNLLSNPGTLSASMQVLCFTVFAALVAVTILMLMAIVGICSGSASSKTLSTVSVALSFLTVFALGLFSKYYQIAVKNNVDLFIELYETIVGDTLPEQYLITVTGGAFYAIPVCAAFVIALLIIKPFTKLGRCCEIVPLRNPAVAEPSDVQNEGPAENSYEQDIPEEALGADKTAEEDKAEDKSDDIINELLSSETKPNYSPDADVPEDFDNCPAFTELDACRDALREKESQNAAASFTGLTLSSLSEFVVRYAAASRNHLSYSKEEIAVFLAGLGMSRLSILQGLSGTGKTSLPKIFAEAVMGGCEIIEVESSWKDKNELLGYYNEFSRVYTPKKFTRGLYLAALDKNTPYLIVLDEMNLSRIEYYFSDFLSLMENDEDKREIRLLEHRIFRTKNGINNSYAALSRDNTLKIPANVWFIGTANRDESTFEISDKVYDRANTIDFTKRAPKAEFGPEKVPARYVSTAELRRILNEALENFEFDIEKYQKLFEVEKILQPYNISFGNRVMRQMDSFVRIYCSCFEDKYSRIDEAMEKIIFSKLVRKLEFKNIRDKDALIRGFEKLRLYSCASFVGKLGGDSFYE